MFETLLIITHKTGDKYRGDFVFRIGLDAHCHGKDSHLDAARTIAQAGDWTGNLVQFRISPDVSLWIPTAHTSISAINSCHTLHTAHCTRAGTPADVGGWAGVRG